MPFLRLIDDMNPEQILNSVETVIKERPVSAASRFVICWFDSKLQCLPSGFIKDDGNIFGNFSYDELTNGLTPDQWSKLSHKIAVFFELKLK